MIKKSFVAAALLAASFAQAQASTPGTVSEAATTWASLAKGPTSGPLNDSPSFQTICACIWHVEMPVSWAIDVAPSLAGANVTAVPEPSSYALLLAGLALLGWKTRSARRAD